MTLWAVLLTGLFAGGASCAAVQGGLLALLGKPTDGVRRAGPTQIADFLAGKLISHAAAGALLGAIGGTLNPSRPVRVGLQLLAGLVMVLAAADLAGLPIAKRLLPAPTGRAAPLVRRAKRTGPFTLGLATIVLPCGVTLSMELLAATTGSPVRGAAVLVVFVIGTVPLFSILGATLTAARRRRGPLAVGLALVLAGVGLVTINGGLALAGSDVTVASVANGLIGRRSTGQPTTTEPVTPTPVIHARPMAFSPATVRVPADTPVTLTFNTRNNLSCTSAVVIPSLKIERTLAQTGNTHIRLGKLKPGRYPYTCSSGMYGGSIDAVRSDARAPTAHQPGRSRRT